MGADRLASARKLAADIDAGVALVVAATAVGGRFGRQRVVGVRVAQLGDAADVARVQGGHLERVTRSGAALKSITDQLYSTARVVGVIAGESRGPKIRVFKFKPKRGYRRKMGHRQELTRIRVTKISKGS